MVPKGITGRTHSVGPLQLKVLLSQPEDPARIGWEHGNMGLPCSKRWYYHKAGKGTLGRWEFCRGMWVTGQRSPTAVTVCDKESDS